MDGPYGEWWCSYLWSVIVHIPYTGGGGGGGGGVHTTYSSHTCPLMQYLHTCHDPSHNRAVGRCRGWMGGGGGEREEEETQNPKIRFTYFLGYKMVGVYFAVSLVTTPPSTT